jgi:hypothetical protein
MAHEASRSREPPRVSTRAVLMVVGGTLLFVGAVLLLLNFYYHWKIAAPVFRPPSAFPEPRVHSDQRAEREALEAAQRRVLAGYAWIDRANGTIAIPIEKAMATIAARGAQAYAPLEAAPPQPVPPAPTEQRP